MRLLCSPYIYFLDLLPLAAAQNDYIGGLLALLQSAGYTTMTKWMNLVLEATDGVTAQAYNALLTRQAPQTLFVPTNQACNCFHPI